MSTYGEVPIFILMLDDAVVFRRFCLMGGEGVEPGKFCGLSSVMLDMRVTADRGELLVRPGGDLAMDSGGERPMPITLLKAVLRVEVTLGGDPVPELFSSERSSDRARGEPATTPVREGFISM